MVAREWRTRDRSGLGLIGRDDEANAVIVLLDRAAAGVGGALAVRGEAGIGKTALLEQARADALQRGFDVRWVVGSPIEHNLPFGALPALVAPELRTAPDGSTLPKPLVAALGGANVESGTNVTAVTTALIELLSTTGERQPVLVLVDDGHWLDPSTAFVIGLLGRQLFADHVAVLVAFRSVDELVRNDRRTATGLIDQPGSVAAFRDLDTIELALLSRSDTETALLAAGCPEALVTELAVRCGGLPLAIREVQRQLQSGVVDLRRLSVSVPDVYRARIAQQLDQGPGRGARGRVVAREHHRDEHAGDDVC